MPPGRGRRRIPPVSAVPAGDRARLARVGRNVRDGFARVETDFRRRRLTNRWKLFRNASDSARGTSGGCSRSTSAPSPASLQRTHRVHFARRLLDETSLPIAQVAFAAGFESVRRFNDAIRATFHRAPRELREESRPRTGTYGKNARGGHVVRLTLPMRLPFDATSLFSFLKERALPGVETVRGHAYFRTIESRGRAGVLGVSHEEGKNFSLLTLDLPPGPDLLDLVRRAGRIFDVDADPLAIGDVLSRDPLSRRSWRPAPGSACRAPGILSRSPFARSSASRFPCVRADARGPARRGVRAAAPGERARTT